MNKLLSSVCLLFLFGILALPLGLIVSQWFARTALQHQRVKEELCD